MSFLRFMSEAVPFHLRIPDAEAYRKSTRYSMIIADRYAVSLDVYLSYWRKSQRLHMHVELSLWKKVQDGKETEDS